MIFQQTRDVLQRLGLPAGDLFDLPTSEQRFPDGAQFRIEVPTINSAAAMRALLETADRAGIVINRVTETYGIMRHTTTELKEYIAMARDKGVELVLSIGPRAPYDTSATVNTPQGVRISYRLRGMEQVIRAVEDVKRVVDLGCRRILVYDEGALWVLAEMRRSGDLPADIKFKVSAHCGHGNPASFKVLESLGADSINPVRDLQLPMIAALRRTIKVALDVHTDNPPGSGGFIRTYEAPEIVRIASPVHLKCGNSVIGGHGELTSSDEGRRMADQASMVVEALQRYYPEAVQSKPGVAARAV